MFWCDVLSDDTKYCTCQGGWYSFKITPSHIQDRTLKVFLTPEGGTECLLEDYLKGYLNTRSKSDFLLFSPWQHVQIRVAGGEITLMGRADGKVNKYRASTYYYPGCAFADIEYMYDRREVAISNNNNNLNGRGERIMVDVDQNDIDVKYIELNRIIQCCEILKKKSFNYDVESSKYMLSVKDLNEIYAVVVVLKREIQQKLKERYIPIDGEEGDDEDLRNINTALLNDLSWILHFIMSYMNIIKKYYTAIDVYDEIILSSNSQLKPIIEKLNHMISSM